MHTSTPRIAALVLTLAGASLLSACGRNDNGTDTPTDTRTTGQKVDQAIATTERKAGEVAADARSAGRDIKEAAGNASDSAANKTKDAAITMEVKTRLARDKQLSALAINVDTEAGRVLLRGTAPDTAARTHATELANAVDGVVEVRNELNVQRSTTN